MPSTPNEHANRPEPPRSHALRLGRHSQPGQVYLVTTVTEGRAPLFAQWQAARQVVQVLHHTQTLGHAETLAFVLMPDHLHWLFSLGTQASLSRVVSAVKSISAHRIGGRVWQAGFHDRALRREESVVDAARYIIENPLRAGLVTCVGDYPHWDAVWLP